MLFLRAYAPIFFRGVTLGCPVSTPDCTESVQHHESNSTSMCLGRPVRRVVLYRLLLYAFFVRVVRTWVATQKMFP
jgi:hypothetical protein